MVKAKKETLAPELLSNIFFCDNILQFGKKV
jgi:hypothetical protein